MPVPRMTYTNSWGDHSLTATAGFTTYYNKLENLNAGRTQGVGLVIPDNPDKWYVSIGDAATATNGSTQWERSTVSVLARILYNYKGKYLFNGSYRRDGSSAEFLLRRSGLVDERRGMDERYRMAGYVETERIMGYPG